jgi:hypothetical protein
MPTESQICNTNECPCKEKTHIIELLKVNDMRLFVFQKMGRILLSFDKKFASKI